MATYMDGMDGGKHNSDNSESNTSPKTQEIRIQAQITLEVSTHFSKEELLRLFNGAAVEILPEAPALGDYWSTLDIIDIEEEAQIYGTE